MTAHAHARIWEAVRNVGAANAAAAEALDTSTLRHTVRLIQDAIKSLEDVEAMYAGDVDVQLSISRDIAHLRGRVADLERRMAGGR